MNSPVRKKPARGRPRDPERQKRRQTEARRAAVDLFLEQGLDGVTIDMIVERLGWAKGSFYRHFRNKDALVAAVFEPMATQVDVAFGKLIDSFAEGADTSLAQTAYELFAAQMSVVLLQNPDAARLFLQERRGPPLGARRPIVDIAQRIEGHALEGATRAKARGMLGDSDPWVVSMTVVGAIEHVLHAYLAHPEARDGMSVAAELTRVLVRGLLLADSIGDR